MSAHYPNFPSLHLCHSSFSNPSVASPTSQLILQSFRCCTNVTAHSPTRSSLHLRHSSYSNSSSLLERHRLFTYVTWRAARETGHFFFLFKDLVWNQELQLEHSILLNKMSCRILVVLYHANTTALWVASWLGN